MRMSHRLAPLLALLPLACVSVREPAPVPGVPFILSYGLVFVELELPGEGFVLALLDTGASASAIDTASAQDLPSEESVEVVGTTGTVPADIVVLEGLRLGTEALPPLRATRRDLSGLLAPEGRSVQMILGSDALLGRVVELDFIDGQLRFSPPEDADPSAGVPMLLDQGIPAIAGTLGGVDVWLRIDTGASLFETPNVYVNIPPSVWRALLDRHPDLVPSVHFQGTGAGGEAVDLPVAAVPSGRIGARDLGRVFVIVQPAAGYFAAPDAKGFVSNNFLRMCGRVALDSAHGRFRAGRFNPAE